MWRSHYKTLIIFSHFKYSKYINLNFNEVEFKRTFHIMFTRTFKFMQMETSELNIFTLISDKHKT
jgi:hypothetical protein